MKLKQIQAVGVSIFLLAATLMPQLGYAAGYVHNTVDENIQNVMKVWCGFLDDDGEAEIYSVGSGVHLGASIVLTNSHVVYYYEEDGDGGLDLYYYDFCWGGIAENSRTAPEPQFNLSYAGEVDNWDSEFDYAFLSAVDDDGELWEFASEASYGNPDSLVHGDEITLIGFPDVTGSTVTTTKGSVAGFGGIVDGEDNTWIKTDAVAEYGSSGGGAFDALGNFIGMPTLVSAGDLNSFTYIQNFNAISINAFGDEYFQRDLDTLYTAENIFCIIEGNDDGSDLCYNFGEGEELGISLDELASVDREAAKDGTTVNHSNEIISLGSEIEAGAYEEEMRDNQLIERLKGYILLQTESVGEAWLVNPDDGLRYYMRDGAVAYRMMQLFGLGITDADLEKIETVDSPEEMLETESVCASNTFANNLRGQMLLRVEQHGEIWWVHPDTCKAIYLADGDAAYSAMRFLSMGITNNDLTKLPTGDIN